MPQGDRTGPTGAGPMTGRGMGPCAGTNTPGYVTGGGGGFGRGMGMGRGFRNRFAGWWNAPQTPAQPMNKTDQVAALKAQMDQIQQQIKALGEAE